MAKFRKIDPRIWNDADFRGLSHLAKLIYFQLKTHPNMTSFGAMRATEVGLAHEIKALPEAFREAFGEACLKGFVKYDPEACFVVLPDFLAVDTPESPNVIRAWKGADDLLPECDLKYELIQSLRAFVKGMSEGFQKAFDEAFPKGYAESGDRRSEIGDKEIPVVPLQGTSPPVENFLEAQTPTAPPATADPPPPVHAREPDKRHGRRKPKGDPGVVERVFAHWQRVMGHPQAKLDRKRKGRIEAALAMGYTEQQLCNAIDGCALSPWHMGLAPDNKTRYDQPGMIFRDADQIDKFIATKANPPPMPKVPGALPVRQLRKECVACKTGFDPGENYKPVGDWVVCSECRPTAEAKYKREEDARAERRFADLGMVKNHEGRWVKPEIKPQEATS